MWCTVCRVAFAICALTASGDAALAQALYKCRAADGSLTYQDRECPPDADELVPPAIAPPPRDPYVPKLPDTIAGDADVPKIQAPLMLHYADPAKDAGIGGRIPAFEAALKANNKKYQLFIYSNANHGFHNDSTGRYDAENAKLAWDRTIAFFKKHLA